MRTHAARSDSGTVSLAALPLVILALAVIFGPQDGETSLGRFLFTTPPCGVTTCGKGTLVKPVPGPARPAAGEASAVPLEVLSVAPAPAASVPTTWARIPETLAPLAGKNPAPLAPKMARPAP